MSSPCACRRPEAERRARREPALGDDLVQHGARIVEERARHLPEFGVVENGGIFALQLPGREERRPVDVVDQFGDRIIGERPGAEERRLRRHVSARPVELGRVGARGGKRQPHLVGLRARVRGGELGVFAAQLGDVVALGLAPTSAPAPRRPRGWRRSRRPPGRVCSSDGSSPPCARGWWWRRRSAAAIRSPAAPSRPPRGTSRRATA